MADDDALRDQIAEAEALLTSLRARADRPRDDAHNTPDDTPDDTPDGNLAAPGATRRGRPVRAVLLDVLYDVGLATYSREAAQLMQALYGRNVAGSRFGVLSADEEQSYISGRTRPVYLGHALTYDRSEPIKRLWIRSDWPLEDRIVGPRTGRVRHLLMTKRLCELAESQVHAVQPQMIRFAAADHAADLPGVRITRGQFDLRHWADIATDELHKVVDDDRRDREQAADRLRTQPDRVQLFGRPVVAAINDASGETG